MGVLRRLATACVAFASVALVGACSGGDVEDLQAEFRWDMNDGKTSGTACSFSTTYFHDQSAGEPTSWRWTFPDGSTSTDQNPVVATPQPEEGATSAFSEVSLTVRRGDDMDSITR